MKEHIPVLLNEVLDALNVHSGNLYIDGTVGLGGHTFEIARRGGRVLGIDRDSAAIEKLQSSLGTEFKDRIALTQGSFGNIKEIAEKEGFTNISGILLDLGYSSWQLDSSGRGFSFSKDESLDMRYDRTTQEITAADIVNKMPVHELVEIISTLGEEEKAEKMVRAIASARPILTTGELVLAIDTVVGHDRERHLARVFQALRIVVNNELGIIKKALPDAVSILKPGGRLAVISFHSLEDRIIKQFYKDHEKDLKTLTKKPIVATREEIKKNSRSRSAKLRVAEKI